MESVGVSLRGSELRSAHGLTSCRSTIRTLASSARSWAASVSPVGPAAGDQNTELLVGVRRVRGSFDRHRSTIPIRRLTCAVALGAATPRRSSEVHSTRLGPWSVTKHETDGALRVPELD